MTRAEYWEDHDAMCDWYASITPPPSFESYFQGAYSDLSPVKIARKPAAAAFRFTPREKQIAALVSRGLSNKKIAAQLGIQEQTIKNQLKVLLDRLGLPNRTSLCAYVLNAGSEVAA